MSSITRPAPAQLAAELEELEQRVDGFARATLSPATLRSYARAWGAFRAWAQARGLVALPAEPRTVALYCAARAEGDDQVGQLSPRSLSVHVAAIGKAHTLAGLESPTDDKRVRMVMRGIRRTHGTPARGKAPAGLAQVARMLDELPTGASGIRDRALLLLGFATALRRSALVALDVEDLEHRAEGLVVLVRRSKTDQEGEGRRVGVPHASRTGLCAVDAVDAWLELLGEERAGPLFRSVDRHGRIGAGRLSSRAVALVVKRAAERAGIRSEELGAHSLRAGFITEAARLGVPEAAIQRHTDHKSLRVLRGYVRLGSLFTGNAAGEVL